MSTLALIKIALYATCAVIYVGMSSGLDKEVMYGAAAVAYGALTVCESMKK